MGTNSRTAIEILHQQYDQLSTLYAEFQGLAGPTSIPEVYERQFPHFAHEMNLISLDLITAWNQIVEQGGLTESEKQYLSKKYAERIATRPPGYHYSFTTLTDPAQSLQNALDHIIWLVAAFEQLAKPNTNLEDIATHHTAISQHMDNAYSHIKAMWLELLRNEGISHEGMALISAARTQKGLPPMRRKPGQSS